jgi:phosphatidylglycerol:prolipoprotein diacylglycerol transferase
MKNELFTIGPFTVYGYGLMIAIGIIAAYLTGEYRAKKLKLNEDRILSLVIWSVAGGLLGAKILFIFTQLEEIMANPKILLNVTDGFVVYGGIIGGIITAIIYCKVTKLDFLQYFDLLMPSVALAQGFGRIGCFLAGCCYGHETTCPIGITFHDSAFAPNGVSLIPTQLISSGLNFLHFFVLLWIAKHKRGDGQVAGFYLIFYSIGRFILEFYRGDLLRGSVGTLSTSQFISIFICIAGIVLVVMRNGKQRGEN